MPFKATQGEVTIEIDDDLALPEKAGNMSPTEVARLPKAPRGIGLCGSQTAAAITKAGPRFLPPPGVTAEALLAAVRRADGIDEVIVSLEVLLGRVKQANLIFDAELWEMLRKVNDQVKAQGKHEPELAAQFTVLRDFMRSPSRRGGGGEDGGDQ